MIHAVAVLFLASLVVAAPAVQDPKPKSPQEARADWIAGFKRYLEAVDVSSLEAIDKAFVRIQNEKRPDPKKKDDVSGWLGSEIDAYVKTRSRVLALAKERMLKLAGLRLKLDAMESQAKDGRPEALARLWLVLRDEDLLAQAADAGGDDAKRLAVLRREVGERYEAELRGAATKALAEATSVEGLAPLGAYEDLLCQRRADDGKPDDPTMALVSPLLLEHLRASDAKVKAMFDAKWIAQQPWVDLLADRSKWTEAGDSKVGVMFGKELVLQNEAGEDARSAGLAFTPADQWRDYVLDLDLTLESGTFVVYVRVPDVMDSKLVPAFTIGANRNVAVTPGVRSRFEARVIGGDVAVSRGGEVVWSDPLAHTKSRKGEPGFVVQPGTKVTIHSLRARLLR